MSGFITAHLAERPYPGLRPFRREEADIFFGREEQVDQLLARLADCRFLAVVGTSGCGKSSLVRAGLMAALDTGFLAKAGSHWRMVVMRPGNHPLHNLALALLDGPGEGPPRSPDGDAVAFLQATLRRGPLGFVEALSAAPLEEGENLLLLVDQFEEIFRFREQGDSDEADAFVALLLATARHPSVAAHVVLTMRSDFLGECALFNNLPEMLNDSQLLTPRLTREQRHAAIEGPARVFGSQVQPALVTRLLNDMGADPDQLPLMQHALMRLWLRAGAGRTEEAGLVLTLEDYEAIGGLAQALDRHADEVYERLGGPQQAIAETLFRSLSERGTGQRDTRRPCPLGQVAEVASVPAEQVAAVAEVFRGPDLNFLTPYRPTPLEPATMLDISHESLIRQWRRMRHWVEQEASSAKTFRRLDQQAHLWQEGKAGLWGTPDLENALAWREQAHLTPAWVRRYGGDLTRAMRFLDESKAAADAARRQENRRKIFKAGFLVLGICSLALIALAIWAFVERNRANKNADHAKSAKEQAEENSRFAEWQRTVAERKGRVAQAQSLAVRADSIISQYPQRGLLLAAEAVQVTEQAKEPRVPATEQTLRDALAQVGGRGLGNHPSPVIRVAFSPDGRRAYSASSLAEPRPGVKNPSPPGPSGDVGRLWDLTAPDGKPLAELGDLQSLATDADGRWLAVGVQDAKAVLWDLTSPAQKPTVFGDHVARAFLSPDGRWLAAAETPARDGSSSICLWQLPAPDPSQPPAIFKFPGGVQALSFSPNGRWLAVTNLRHSSTWALDLPNPKTPIIRVLDLTNPKAPPITLTVPIQAGKEQSGSNKGDQTPGANLSLATALTFSPDGRYLATIVVEQRFLGKADNVTYVQKIHSAVLLWDLTSTPPVQTPHLLAPTDETPSFYSNLRFSSDSRQLVVVFDKSDGQQSPSQRLRSAGSLALLSWDLAANNPKLVRRNLALEGGSSQVGFSVFSPSGRWLLAGGMDRVVLVWDLEDKGTGAPRVLRGHEGAVGCAAFSPDDRWLITGSDDHTARLWDLNVLNPGASPVVLGWSEAETATAISPDRRYVAVSAKNNSVRLWDSNATSSAGESRVVTAPETPAKGGEEISALAVGADGRWLAAGGPKGIAWVWDMGLPDPSAKPLTLLGHEGSVSGLTFSPDGRWLVTSVHNARTAHLWDLTLADPAARPLVLRGHEGRFGITALAVSRNSRWLATGGYDKSVRVWDLTLADPTAQPHVLSGHQGSITALAFSPNSRWLASGALDRTTRLWDLGAPDPAARPVVLDGPRGRVGISLLVFSADARWLVTGSQDNVVYVWATTAPDPAAAPHTLARHEGAVLDAAFSPDSRWLVTGAEDKTARVWSLEDVSQPPAVLEHDAEVVAVALGPVRADLQARQVITASLGQPLRLWDVSPEGKASVPIILRNPRQSITSLTISRDGRWLLTRGQGVFAWPLWMKDLLELARNTAGRKLTPKEMAQYFPEQMLDD